jgi:hypothetical protein
MDFALQSSLNERYEGQTTGSDEFGVIYTYSEAAAAPIVTPGTCLLPDITKWKERLKFPKVDDYDWEAGAKRDTATWDRENKFSVVMLFNGPFERLHALMGFEEGLIALVDEPEIVSDYIAAFQEYRKKMIKKIGEYYKPDAVMIFDDYGTANGMMMSPGIWRSVIKPHLKQVIDTAHECGMYYIFHSCGYIKPIFSDIVEMGPDVVQPMQACNNVEELKAQYGGRVTFTGGILSNETFDNPVASEEEMRAEVRRVIRVFGEEGSYIAWPVILSSYGKRIFLDEIMRDSIPKMQAAGVEPPEWKNIDISW